MNKKQLLTFTVLSSCLLGVMGCQSDNKSKISKEVDKSRVVFNKNNIVLNNFEGLGVEWGTYEDPDKLSSGSWERSLKIMDRLNPQVTRCMLNYDWFITNFDDKGDDDKSNDTWEYNFSNKLMNNTIDAYKAEFDKDVSWTRILDEINAKLGK